MVSTCILARESSWINLQKTTKNFIQDSQCPDRVSNLRPSEYELLTIEQ